MSGAINKVKDALHLNKDHTTTTGTTHTTGAHSTTSGVPEGTAGPHSSRVANAADPRIDSDLDSSRHTGHTGTTGVHTGTGTGITGNTHSHTTGTHTTGTHTGGGVAGTSHTVGPHSSILANKVDPRVDSDLSNVTGGHHTSATTGTHAGNTSGTHTGTTGGISHSTNAGPHNSNLANKADPRVDSDLSGSGNRHGASTGASAGVFGASGSHATAGSGTAQNTAGPHNSDLANKLDPRVDADRDGSKTYGGNKTHAGEVTHRDVHDASQVPPSVFAAHQGESEISDDFKRRHSVLSHQDKHSGI